MVQGINLWHTWHPQGPPQLHPHSYAWHTRQTRDLLCCISAAVHLWHGVLNTELLATEAASDPHEADFLVTPTSPAEVVAKFSQKLVQILIGT